MLIYNDQYQSLAGRVQITLLPLNSATELGKKLKFDQSFHYAFFSNRSVCVNLNFIFIN